MAAIKRYYTALRRYNRSKGFGIHSPFAFSFVLHVLRERLPYYCYEEIESRRQLARRSARDVSRHPRVISAKNAKMIFRVAAWSGSRHVLQVGTSYGVSTMALLLSDSRTRVSLYQGANPHADIYAKVVDGYDGRVDDHSTLSAAVDSYWQGLPPGQRPLMLVNSLGADDDLETASRAAREVLSRQGVVILRNLTRDALTRGLWDQLTARITAGMGFTNGKLAVIVGFSHLPRQDFSLWF